VETTAVTGGIWIINLTAEHAKIVSVLRRIALVALSALVVKCTIVRIVPADYTVLVEEIGRAVQWFFDDVVPGHCCF